MAQYSFGSGQLWGITSGSNPVAVRFGGLQNASVDFSGSIKSLFATYHFPLAIARGTTQISGKASFVDFSAKVLNTLFFGGSLAAGTKQIILGEAGTPTGSVQKNVLVGNSANFVRDLGVRNGTTGAALVRVPWDGTANLTLPGDQYGVSAGKYIFSDSNTPASVLIDYEYTVAGSGQTMTLSNTVLGSEPAWTGTFSLLQNGQRTTLNLNHCRASKFSFATKMDDFAVPDFEFGAGADSANIIGTWAFAE
jgi:hypothetical protein